MIELIIGIVVLVVTVGFGLLVTFAAAMSDNPSASNDVLGSLWYVFGGGAAIDVVLFLIWFAKHKGWN